MQNAPGTYWIFYSDGTKGIRHKPNHREQGPANPDQGSEGKPTQWSGGTTEGDAATPSEIQDIEMELLRMRDPHSVLREGEVQELPKKGQ